MSELSYNEFKKFLLEKSELPRIFFLTGEPMLVSQCEKTLLSYILGEKYTDFDFATLNDETFSNESLHTAVETLPMTTNKKCISVRDIPWEDFTPESFESFMQIIADIPPFSVLIITQVNTVVGNKNSAKLLKTKNFIKKKGIYINLSQSDIPLEKQLISWAKKEYNKTLSSFNAKKIMDLCKGYPIHEIKSELKKICEFEKEETITPKSLEIICKSTSKISIFELPKSLFNGNMKKCFEIMEKLFTQGEEPFVILSVLSAEYIDIYRVKIFLEYQKDPLDLKNLFDYKSKEFRISTAVKRSKNLSKNAIQQCLELIIDSYTQLLTSLPKAKLIISKLLVLLNQKNRGL